MAVVNQIYTLVNGAVQQAFGNEEVQLLDASMLVSTGKYILSSKTSTDLFTKALIDRIGKTIFDFRDLEMEEPLLMDGFTYGLVMQKIYVDPLEAKQSETYNLTNPFTQELFIEKPTVSQKLFASLNAWQVQVTISRKQLQTAFTSEEELTKFVSMIISRMEMSMKHQSQETAKLVYSTMICHKVNNNKARNLLKEYNATFGTTLTASKCLVDLDFLRFASSEIILAIENLKSYVTILNDEGYARHTPSNYARVSLLSRFASNCKTYLQSNTFNDELIKLPKYNEVAYWQGPGTNFDFEDISKVNLKITTNEETGTKVDVTATGVLGMITDVEAMGMTIVDRRSIAYPLHNAEAMNYIEKADFGYFVDLSENAIVFFVADEVTP